MSTDLESRLRAIELRNKKVEEDKAWETSWTRKISIMLLTYLVVAFYLYFVVQINPWVNSLVPVIGFVLSTITVSLLKKVWLKRRNK
jgi:hypothetical protein